MKAFELQQQVRFGHVDPAGIVYFPRIYDYIHEAFEEVWEVWVGARYYHLLLEKRIGFPLVNADVRFESPLRFGDRPIVRVTCFHLGNSSIGLRYQYRLGETLCVDARMTTVCVQLDEMKPMTVPPEYRERFEAMKEEL